MTTTRPNIIVILSDDQGPWAMGCAGNDEIRTPHLDRLASEGMRLDRFFCASPVCSPARASLLTGQIPSQHGIHDWLSAGSVPTEGRGPIEYLKGKPSYTKVLVENGYTCGISGKWHLGHSQLPQHGFSHWYVHQRGGGSYYDAPMIRDGELITEPGYVTDNITNDALAFIDAHYDQAAPFYLSVHYTAPHSPWIDSHPQEIVDSYADCPFDSIPRDPIHPWSIPELAPDPESDLWRAQLAGYFAAVTAMDSSIGRILDKVDTLGMREDTIIWFMGDNGFSTGHHGTWGKGNATWPLNMLDNSVLVPSIVSHPGTIPESIVRSEMVSGYDVAHTLLDLVGLEMPNASDLPGQSFAHLLASQADESAQVRDHIVIHDEYGPVRMIRTEEWKYIHRYPDGPHELFNMVEDPLERSNRIDDPPCQPIVTYLQDRLDAWFLEYVDPDADGLRQPVTGSGQRNLMCSGSSDNPAFEQGQRLLKEAEHREP